ncbi:YrbL family protein [Larsenimonas rhizosphaerae]|uniref:YrbL family protein n=1 Tax=Larsenimonas rhizosphaerae TaxID=2944682 RepID=A0AA42CWX0_9GAMM|nr:YrbL family protein [Larsenimonas rhizosphaerae]MCX2523163.1 YrbL family protein [Larsenimonas rhizosphaerae]
MNSSAFEQYLSTAVPIGKGNDRVVYRLPACPERCIKLPRYPLRGSEQSRREKKYFERLEARGIPYWEYIPRYHGAMVVENHGEGLIYDLILDKEGGVARTIRHYRSNQFDVFQGDAFCRAFEALCVFLMNYWIVPSDINDRNIVCVFTDQEGCRLYLIDGVSNPALFPIANYSSWFARRRIRKRLIKLAGKFKNYGLINNKQCNIIIEKLTL